MASSKPGNPCDGRPPWRHLTNPKLPAGALLESPDLFRGGLWLNECVADVLPYVVAERTALIEGTGRRAMSAHELLDGRHATTTNFFFWVVPLISAELAP